jgi:hypothetical protein
MTAAAWNNTRAAALAAIAEYAPDFHWSDDQRAYMDAVAAEVIDREVAVQAAIDLQVRRILALELPAQWCPCGEPLATEGYHHNPCADHQHGHPPTGFVVMRGCRWHGRHWFDLGVPE